LPLNKLDNFIKNTEGRILYVSPSDLDSTDSISNQGNSLAQPFKTLQRALLEAARFSYQLGNSNDIVEKTTILLMPGEHVVDNRPGFAIKDDSGAKAVSPSGTITQASTTLTLDLNSNFDLTQENNILYKFNSVNGGIVVPRGTSVVGLDLRKTKIRPKYVPNPTDSNVPNSAIFRITGACYFWQFSIFDGDESGLVYTDPQDYSINNQSKPTFSHHKLTIFEYADGKNKVVKRGTAYDLTDLDMYYSKLSNAFNQASGRKIEDVDKYPANPDGFGKRRPEWEIVGAFSSDPIDIQTIESGSGGTATPDITVKTTIPHGLNEGTPIKIRGVGVNDYNVSTKVSYVDPTDPTVFKYLLASVRRDLPTPPSASGATVTVETDTVSGASPYIFNCSMRSVWGMNGMLADGSKASGFRSMVVAQFTGVSLQKDDRAFVKYNPVNRDYSDTIAISRVAGASLANGASSTDTSKVYHLDSQALYRNGWESSHIKATNDSFIQIVSVFAIGYNKHFDSQTGADLSITNSNSNFGQISLSASGFKKEAFVKDNKAFITSIIAPRAITSTENNIDWIPLDVVKTRSGTINPNKNRLYLYGFTTKDDIPPILTQGYRIGARVSDKIYFTGDGLAEYSANILMSDGVTSSVKEYSNIPVPDSSFNFTIGAHTLSTGEKVIILSDDGDLPENIIENTVYYVINNGNNNTIKLASSKTNADNGTAITVYKGTSLRILSRVSDKVAGDIGHPVQYDETNSNWYINTLFTDTTSNIWNGINSNHATLGSRTEPSYVKRYSDSRSLDEKLYKVRVVIPKEYDNSKKPENGFVLQESSTTGIINKSSLVRGDYDYNKNPRLIAKCTYNGSSTVTVISELPHNLQNNDSVIIKNVTDSTSGSTGIDDLGYNGTYTVTVVDDMTFTYATIKTPGTFTNNTSLRTITSPRFERNDLQSNLYIYRNEVITSYIDGVQDGVYHLYILNANNAIDQEFTNLKYSQNIVDLYPQLDRDNINDTPNSAKSFATRFPLGQVVTNDLKKSITKESLDSLLTSFGVGLDVSSVPASPQVNPTITFARNHGLAGIVTYSNLIKGTGYTPTSGITTYHNVKLLNGSQLSGSWRGATATVIVNSGIVTYVDITSSGSGYSAGSLFFDASTIGSGSGASITIATSGISTSIGNVVQFTGAGITTDSYYRITSVPSATTISIAKTAGDPIITASQYAFVVGPSIQVSSSPYISATTGITSFTCSSPHGLVAGNRFRVIDSSNNNLGDFLVDTKSSLTVFTAITNKVISANGGYILKHGLSANDKTSDSTLENLGARSVSLYDDEVLTVVLFYTANQIRVSSPISASGMAKRFPLGTYIQIDEEIMRITSNYSVDVGYDVINVERGIFGTIAETHAVGSLIQKIKPIAVEFRRPAILRASGHTFEYLGYGPGNYSTGLPQVQVKTLTEREDFLVQSQERSCGLCVYTGMNNNGDVFNGNTKTTASSGEVVSYDIPKPTVTGEDPSRLSVVYDEVTIKERLVVEGGNSRTVLSQFDGPVSFNKEVKINDQVTLTKPTVSNASFTLKINDTEDSTSKTTGALIVTGGVGIGQSLNVGGNLGVTGIINASTPNDGTTGGVRIAANSTTNYSYLQFISSNKNTEYALISAGISSLTLSSTSGTLINLNDTVVVQDILRPSTGSGDKGIVWASDPGDGTGDTAFIKYYVESGENTRLHIGIKNDADDDLYLEATQTTTSGALTVTTTFNAIQGITGASLTALNSGSISGGAITGSSLNVSTGNISGGAISGSSLNVSTGNISGGAISGSSLNVSTGNISGGAISGSSLNVSTGNISGGAISGSSLNVSTGNISGGAITGSSLSVTGDVTAFYNASDRNWKDNIVPISNSLNKVLKLSGNTFDWNEKSTQSGRDVGVIAQEVQEVLPEASIEREDGHISVSYIKLVPLLIEAIKELKEEINELKRK